MAINNTLQIIQNQENKSQISNNDETLKMKRRKNADRYLKFYYKNHDVILKERKIKDKLFNERYKKRFHCEKCDKYFTRKKLAEKHFITNKHQKAVEDLLNKFVIKDNKINEYIM